MSDSTTDTDEREPDSDEMYCTSCGEIIKQEAELCPECGTRQAEEEAEGESSIPEHKQYELQKVADKSTGIAVALGIFITPLAYVYVGKNMLALLNFLTLNYFLLGFIIVPIHTWKIINDAQETLQREGINY